MLELTYFASTATTESGPIAALGIDGTLLAFQVVAFCILMFALGKWVYPVFIGIIDKRQAMIEESTRAAVDAEKNAEKTQSEIAALLTEARTEAREIVTTAKEEAAAMVSDAETKSKTQADHIVANAHESIAKEVLAAKKMLHNETIDLVAAATEKVIGKTIDAKLDAKVIKAAVEESK